jgi:diacylglycerol kinase (ATP)
MEDYAIVYNPASASGKSKKDFDFTCKCLDDLGVLYKKYESEYAGHIIELAAQLAKEGYRVIAVGGDGTCNEVLNGVIQSNTGVLIGFIPIGSGNDIPGAIGIRPDIKRACEIIAEGHTGKFDIGIANTEGGIKRYFLGIGSQGFDAEVTRRTNESKRQNYVLSVLKTIIRWKTKEIKVEMDNDKYEGMANLVAIGNGPSYGGFMYICSKAKIDDGMFHISIVSIGKLRLLFDFNKLYSASLSPHPNIHEFVSKKVRIDMKNPEDEPYICQVDGEVLGNIPVTYEIPKDGYEFICPEFDEVAEAFKAKHGRYFYEPK